MAKIVEFKIAKGGPELPDVSDTRLFSVNADHVSFIYDRGVDGTAVMIAGETYFVTEEYHSALAKLKG